VNALSDAYSAGASAWAKGPERVYGKLAGLLIDMAPTPLTDQVTLDLGAGAGAASRYAARAGARVIAVDSALGMLQHNRGDRPPGTLGDARMLPIRDRGLDVVIAAFCLNHLDDPVLGVREINRVLRPGGYLLASTYAADDNHPVKQVVEQALAEQGWRKPQLYGDVRRAMASWGTTTLARLAIEAGGMEPTRVERASARFPEMTPKLMIEWRLGLAQSYQFFVGLTATQREQVMERCRELLGSSPEPVVRRVIFVTALAR
jgi:SAM-dependent methyltransferase